VEYDKDQRLRLLGETSDSKIAIIKENTKLGQTYVTAEVTDSDGENSNEFTLLEYRLKLMEKGLIKHYRTSYLSNDKIITLSTNNYKEDKTSFNIIEKFDLNGELLDTKKIQVTRYKNKERKSEMTLTLLSPDKTKLAIITQMEYDRKGNDMINISIMDIGTFDVLADEEILMSTESPKRFHKNYFVSNTGSLFLMNWDENFEHSLLCSLIDKKWKETKMTTEHKLVGDFFEFDNQIEFVGIEEAGLKRIMAFSHLIINPLNGEISADNTIQLEDQKIQDLFADEYYLKENKKAGEYLVLELKKVIYNDLNDNYIYINEETHDSRKSTTVDSKTTHTYNFDTKRQVIFSMSRDNEINWKFQRKTSIPITNRPEKTNIYQGFNYFLDGDGNLHALYNSQAATYTNKNEEKVAKSVLLAPNQRANYLLLDFVLNDDGTPQDHMYGEGNLLTNQGHGAFLFQNRGFYDLGTKQYALLFNPFNKGYKLVRLN
jgi:hypothetical protein